MKRHWVFHAQRFSEQRRTPLPICHVKIWSLDETCLKKAQTDRQRKREFANHTFYQGFLVDDLFSKVGERGIWKKIRKGSTPWKLKRSSCVLPSETEGHHLKTTTKAHGRRLETSMCDLIHGWKTKSALTKRRMSNIHKQQETHPLCNKSPFWLHRGDLIFLEPIITIKSNTIAKMAKAISIWGTSLSDRSP